MLLTGPRDDLKGGISMSVISNPMLQHNENDWPGGRPESYEDRTRIRSGALWLSVFVLAVALGFLVYYAYNYAKTQNLRITQIFGNQEAMDTLTQRLGAAETEMHDLAGDWQGVAPRVTALEGRVAMDAKQTRMYAQSLTLQLHQQLTAEMDARIAALNARLNPRLAQIESEQADQRAQLDAVEANLKQDISTVRDENGRELSGVRRQEGENARDITAISQRLDRERIDFELGKGQEKDLLPGISLRIEKMNPTYQRYRASLWLLQDRRTVWLRDQSVHESVRFFHKDGGDQNEPYELVVTDVNKKAVVGYLLAPVKPEASAAALIDKQTSGEASPRE
jgi:hypothetical protein